MTYQPFLIANQRVAKETDLDPWLLPDDAYPTMENVYLYRGTLRRKGGSIPFGRLGIRNDAYPYNATLIVRAGSPQTYAGNLLFTPVEPGSVVITDGVTVFTDNGLGVMAVTAGSGNAGTINYTTGAFSVVFTAANNNAPVTATYFVVVNSDSPCMGLCTYDIQTINNDSLIAFDMVQAYLYNNGAGIFNDISTYKIGPNQTTTTNVLEWSGSNSQFFSYENFQGAFFETNNVPGNHFYAITNITIGAGAQITTAIANNYAAGDIVYINNVLGSVTIGGNSINNQQLVVTVAGNPFTVAQTTAGVYTSGGIAWEETNSAAASGTPGIGNDGIRWYDGTGWVNFSPPLSGTFANGPTYPNILQGALLLFAYKGRLVALSTFEGVPGVAPQNFQQRARWSQDGVVFYGSVYPQNTTPAITGTAWYNSPIYGGGMADAPTGEAIVSAEFIKDTLVVYFERSTYRLLFTNNNTQPFIWQKINTEIGCESTWSIIPFDKEILSVGPNGLYACDSLNIVRIDQKIPDVVFGFGNANAGTARINGIRDFYDQFAYWTYVDDENSVLFPNAVLAYNYVDHSFSTFTGSYTCFGHYQTVTSRTWGNTPFTWGDMDETWGAPPLQGQFPIVIAGNQQGYVVQLNLVSADDDQTLTNAVTLHIQAITNANPSVFTVNNHNLSLNSSVQLSGSNLAFTNAIYQVQNVTTNTFTLLDQNGANVIFAGYSFGGEISLIDNFKLVTKEFTPFIESGQKVRVGYIDILLESNNSVDPNNPGNYPQFTLGLFENYSQAQPQIQQIVSENDQFDNTSTLFWRRVYLNQTCRNFSLAMTYAQGLLQIFNPFNNQSTFEIHGMIIWMAPAGRVVR